MAIPRVERPEWECCCRHYVRVLSALGNDIKMPESIGFGQTLERQGESGEKAERPAPEKDKLITDFLKILKVAFKMATMYNLDHPAFKTTVEDLEGKLASLFHFLDPVSIGFTPHSLFLDERFWEGERTYLGLAQLFHLRKIKRLEIRHGIALGELMRFASRITLPIKEFIKLGGAEAVLKKENIIHISVEVLDYGLLLQGEGEEIKDIWPYLLMEAVEEDDHQKLDQLAGSFERVVGRFNSEDLIQNEELQKNFVKFFRYLKNTSQEKHRLCAKNLLKSVMAGQKTPTESKFENLKLLISDMNEQDLASTLWEEIIGNEKFDSLDFTIFTRIIDKERHKKISTSLQELFHSDDPQNKRADVEKKIKTLLAGTSGQLLSDIYRQTLTDLLNEISFDKKVSFELEVLQKNYSYMLLNLLAEESQPEDAARQLNRISEEWDRIAEERDLEYLDCLLEVMQGRSQEIVGEPAFQKLRRALSELVEGFILEGDDRPGLTPFIEKLRESVLAPHDYLDKILMQKAATPTMLRAYFGFFGAHLSDLKAGLKRLSSDTRFLERFAAALEDIDQAVSLDLLKYMFLLGDPTVKIRILKAMHHLSEYDEAFLFSALDSKDRQIQAEALLLLMRNERTKHVAFAKLLNLQSPYGIRNKKLIRHIRIVEEKSLRDSGPFLESLASRGDFWNRRVRQEARKLLEKWCEG
jgi:hypothetical protein